MILASKSSHSEQERAISLVDEENGVAPRSVDDQLLQEARLVRRKALETVDNMQVVLRVANAQSGNQAADAQAVRQDVEVRLRPSRPLRLTAAPEQRRAARAVASTAGALLRPRLAV